MFCTNGNVKLWTESFGDSNNPAVLLVAGAHAPSIFWPDFFCEQLDHAGYFVIRYDHRDIGYSTHFPVTEDLSKPIYDLYALAYDSLSILDCYNIGQANVMGHSMGGSVVQFLAALHSDRVLKSVSISAPVTASKGKNPRHDVVIEELFKNKPSGDFENDWPAWKRSMELLSGTGYKFDEDMAKDYVRVIYERHQDDFNIAWNHIAAQQSIPILSDKLPKDMLFINGTDDVFSPCEDIAPLSNGFKVEILHGVGHLFFNRDLWQKIFNIVIEYLGDNDQISI